MCKRQALDLCVPGTLLNGVLNLNNINLYLHSNFNINLQTKIVRIMITFILSFILFHQGYLKDNGKADHGVNFFLYAILMHSAHLPALPCKEI